MHVMLDIMGSTIIAGVILLLIFKLNIYSFHSRYASDSELELQQNAKTLAEILSYDLRKIGYEYDGDAIVQADSTTLSYYSDINDDGTPNLITYYAGDPSEVPQTSNPKDIILYRVVDSDTGGGPSLGLVKVKFSYLDKSGYETADISLIEYVRAELFLESREKIQDEYKFTYWEMTLNPRNL